MKWTATIYPGVRYRESARGKAGCKDKYFALRYSLCGKSHEEGLGWAGDGWTAKKAAAVLADLRKAQATGEGPQTLRERRELARKAREATAYEEKAEKVASMTLCEFLDAHYMPAMEKRLGSSDNDRYRINKEIKPALGHLPLRAIGKEDIERLLERIAKRGAAQASVNQYHAILRQAYNLAAVTKVDGVPVLDGPSPLAGIEAPVPKNERERWLTYEEADTLIAAARERDADMHDGIVISLNTGLRAGEIRRMEWIDVDLMHGILTVRDAPHRKPGGKIPLNADAKAVFKARLKLRQGKERKVFPGIKGEDRDFSKSFRKLVAELGLNDESPDRLWNVVFHTLRHTFASWLAIAGTDIYRIKKLMRHKTLAMTERYAHLIPDATKDAVHNLRPPKDSSC